MSGHDQQPQAWKRSVAARKQNKKKKEKEKPKAKQRQHNAAHRDRIRKQWQPGWTTQEEGMKHHLSQKQEHKSNEKKRSSSDEGEEAKRNEEDGLIYKKTRQIEVGNKHMSVWQEGHAMSASQANCR